MPARATKGARDLLAEVTTALRHLGGTTIGKLARETRHGIPTISRAVDQLRRLGLIFPVIPEDLPACKISPGRVIWVLLPKEVDHQNLTPQGEWE